MWLDEASRKSTSYRQVIVETKQENFKFKIVAFCDAVLCARSLVTTCLRAVLRAEEIAQVGKEGDGQGQVVPVGLHKVVPRDGRGVDVVLAERPDEVLQVGSNQCFSEKFPQRWARIIFVVWRRFWGSPQLMSARSSIARPLLNLADIESILAF